MLSLDLNESGRRSNPIIAPRTPMADAELQSASRPHMVAIFMVCMGSPAPYKSPITTYAPFTFAPIPRFFLLKRGCRLGQCCPVMANRNPAGKDFSPHHHAGRCAATAGSKLTREWAQDHQHSLMLVITRNYCATSTSPDHALLGHFHKDHLKHIPATRCIELLVRR